MNFSLHEDVQARLKAADPDRVRAAMFSDEEARARLMLLYAFHLELAKVPELVSESMIFRAFGLINSLTDESAILIRARLKA